MDLAPHLRIPQYTHLVKVTCTYQGGTEGVFKLDIPDWLTYKTEQPRLLPGNTFIPTKYSFQGDTLSFLCARREGQLTTPSAVYNLLDLVPVYTFKGPSGTPYELDFRCQFTDEGFLDLPEPDEKGRYLIPPPGGRTKSCRK